MTNFNPYDLFNLAVEIRNAFKDEIPDACARTVTNRAYYAAFLIARKGCPYDNQPQIHQYYIRGCTR